MIRRPPRSTLFPYPPLSRSYVDGILKDTRTRRSPFWNPDFLEDLAREHVHGRKNYVLEIDAVLDRKSTRLNSSHSQISYAVFCLKKKTECTRRTSSSDKRDT